MATLHSGIDWKEYNSINDIQEFIERFIHIDFSSNVILIDTNEGRRFVVHARAAILVVSALQNYESINGKCMVWVLWVNKHSN